MGLRHQDEDVYWCPADIGWVTGHSYVAFGPLIEGATVVIYEGALDFPQPDRWWSIVERYGVSTTLHDPDGDQGADEVRGRLT